MPWMRLVTASPATSARRTTACSARSSRGAGRRSDATAAASQATRTNTPTTDRTGRLGVAGRDGDRVESLEEESIAVADARSHGSGSRRTGRARMLRLPGSFRTCSRSVGVHSASSTRPTRPPSAHRPGRSVVAGRRPTTSAATARQARDRDEPQVGDVGLRRRTTPRPRPRAGRPGRRTAPTRPPAARPATRATGGTGSTARSRPRARRRAGARPCRAPRRGRRHARPDASPARSRRRWRRSRGWRSAASSAHDDAPNNR